MVEGGREVDVVGVSNVVVDLNTTPENSGQDGRQVEEYIDLPD